MTDIHKPNRLYDIAHFFVNRCVGKSYRATQVTGLHHIPDDGAVILVANHCNTLMDALVVLRARGMEITVFGARADLYNNPTIAKVVRFLKILPMVRERDGLRNVVKNFDTMDQVSDIIEDGVKFCFYPEGTHRPKHSLLPIRKGLTRFVMAADEKLPEGMPIYMVPVGIEYGDYFRFHSTSLVTFGKPVELRSMVRAVEDKNMPFFKGMSELYTQKISELITYIPDDENYDGVWSLTKILRSGEGVITQACRTPLSNRLAANREAVAVIEKKLNSDADRMARILADSAAFEEKRKAAGISTYSFFCKNRALNVTERAANALICIPAAIMFGIFSLPTWLTAKILCAKVFKDRAFHNTGRTVCMFLWTPILSIFWLVIGWTCWNWIMGILFLLMAINSYQGLWDCMGIIRKSMSDFKLLGRSDLYREWKSLRSRFKAL